jgi:nucleoside-diphosphate-sugar epimerase
MEDHWSGRRVAVTGAGGFIGSHLIDALVGAGAEVSGFFRYTSGGQLGPAETTDSIEVVLGDLREPEAVATFVSGADVILHLGAEVAIPYSFNAPRQVVETNVLGTLNVLLAATRAEVSRVVVVSSSEVYGTPAELPITEAHPLAPQSPYAASKVGADMLAQSFHATYELPVGVIRPFNTYGPRQSPRAVIPTLLSQALAGGAVRLGSLEPVRDFTFVADTVTGILAFAEWDGSPGATVQLGTGEAVSVSALVDEVGHLMGRELLIEHDPERTRPEAAEVMALVSDPARARALLGWEPEVSLREGLATTIDWIQEHPEHYPRPGSYAI